MMTLFKKHLTQVFLSVIAMAIIVSYQNCGDGYKAASISSEIADNDTGGSGGDDGGGDSQPPAPLVVPANWANLKASLVLPTGCSVKKIGKYDFLNFEFVQNNLCATAFQVNFLSGKTYEFIIFVPEFELNANVPLFAGFQNYTRVQVVPNFTLSPQTTSATVTGALQGFYSYQNGMGEPLVSGDFIPFTSFNLNYNSSNGSAVTIVENPNGYTEPGSGPGKFVLLRLTLNGNPSTLISNNQNHSIVTIRNTPPCANSGSSLGPTPFVFGNYRSDPFANLTLRNNSQTNINRTLKRSRIPAQWRENNQDAVYLYSPLCYNGLAAPLNQLYNSTGMSSVTTFSNTTYIPIDELN